MTSVLSFEKFRPSGNSSFVGAGRYKPDQLTEAVSNSESVSDEISQ